MRDYMKFIADAMLGKLAKRMRLHGFDVLYDPALDDNAIIQLSLKEGRTILTRDAGLVSRPLAENHLMIDNDLVDEQLHQVMKTCSLCREVSLTRCSVCNGPLADLDRNVARDLVPEHVYAADIGFSICGNCGKVYWRGSHVRNMAG